MPPDQQIIYLNPRDILPSSQNVRSDPGNLAGLAETIREHGVLQPLGVAPEGQAYRVVYGNRRRDAAIVVGLDRVPCVTVEASAPQDVMIQQVLENLQRLDLNDMDKAQAFDAMLRELAASGVSQGDALDRMARTLGLSSRQIQRYLRLLQLSPQVRQRVATGAIGVTHAQHLVDITPDERQEAIADLVIEETLSAAELARLCASLARNPNIAPAAALAILRRGEDVPRVEARHEDPIRSFSAASLDGGRDGIGDIEEDPPAPWEDAVEPEFAGASPPEDFSRLEPVTRDGNRVLRIHSLDSFVDEIQRLTQCLQSGDLQRLIEADPESPLKLGLAARQLRFLSEAVSVLAQAGH
ncbi:MAG: ParB/RepB/Spo0J family partition protein [Chloroflexi bacterium]|nr:ParB/RepB/Spo0J family partition protein [Chloroflexota bacterium]